MFLAGLPVRDADVLDLAGLLHDGGFGDTAETLVFALEAEQALVALSIQDREAILRALDDPPDSLTDLRDVLLGEHAWRQLVGLVPGEIDWDSADHLSRERVCAIVSRSRGGLQRDSPGEPPPCRRSSPRSPATLPRGLPRRGRKRMSHPCHTSVSFKTWTTSANT